MTERQAVRLLRRGVPLPPPPLHCALRPLRGLDTAVDVVARARLPWCPGTAHLYGPAQRASLPEMVWLGKQIAAAHTLVTGLEELWILCVMPCIITREWPAAVHSDCHSGDSQETEE